MGFFLLNTSLEVNLDTPNERTGLSTELAMSRLRPTSHCPIKFAVTVESFRNEILAASLAKENPNVSVILISEFGNSEIRITSTFRLFATLPGFHLKKPVTS